MTATITAVPMCATQRPMRKPEMLIARMVANRPTLSDITNVRLSTIHAPLGPLA